MGTNGGKLFVGVVVLEVTGGDDDVTTSNVFENNESRLLLTAGCGNVGAATTGTGPPNISSRASASDLTFCVGAAGLLFDTGEPIPNISC